MSIPDKCRRFCESTAVEAMHLERQHGVTVSLRAVERAVAPFRRELRLAEIATVRFEQVSKP
jgi:hypothetical protein